jgi:transposase-like protein
MRRGYPPEFRRKVLDLIQAGRSVAQVAHALQITQTICTCCKQELIDSACSTT